MSAIRQQGAALLTAMLTVTLVATFAAAALWQQWRSVEIESAERSRTQMQWVLNGALDWARLILQEDGRDSQVDHLSEPWALPLQEARLSSFLAVDKSNTQDALEAFLSGQISDQQALLNVRNLVLDGKPNPSSVLAFGRLFAMLNLPKSQLNLLVDRLIAADAASAKPNPDLASESAATAPFKPYRLEHLTWLGLPTPTVRALSPYATLLPAPSPLNLNTAGAEVLSAAFAGMDRARAQQWVAERSTAHFKTVADAFKAGGVRESGAGAADAKDFSVNSRYFAVRGRLRLGDSSVQEVSLVERVPPSVKVIWRQRETVTAPAVGSLQ